MTNSSESDDRPSKRTRKNTGKTASTGDSDGDGRNTRKSRGRPKLNTQDETAADRRRTQIRLAQRAYRLRKENAITSLRKQVSDLQSTIDSMQQSFLRFNDSALSSGALTLDLAQQLQETTETFVRLAKAASATAEAGEESMDIEPALEETASSQAETAEVESGPSKKRSKTSTTSHGSQNPLEQTSSTNIGAAVNHPLWDYSQTFYNEGHRTSNAPAAPNSNKNSTLRILDADFFLPEFSPARQSHGAASPNNTALATTSQQKILPFGLLAEQDDSTSDSTSHSLQQYHVTLPSNEHLPFLSSKGYSPPIYSPNDKNGRPESLTKNCVLQAPYTYSFQETTFGRRLHRAALERAYHLIGQSRLRPTRYEQVFRLSLLLHDREALLSRFATLLKRSTTESLEYVQAPFIHLGGAGTHYPQRDASGTVLPKRNAYAVCQIGPQPAALARLVDIYEPNRPGKPELVLDIEGYEGEWFDPYDVQGFLEERGVRIDPQASFSEAEIYENANGKLVPAPSQAEKQWCEQDQGQQRRRQQQSLFPESFFSIPTPDDPSSMLTRGLTPLTASLALDSSSATATTTTTRANTSSTANPTPSPLQNTDPYSPPSSTCTHAHTPPPNSHQQPPPAHTQLPAPAFFGYGAKSTPTTDFLDPLLFPEGDFAALGPGGTASDGAAAFAASTAPRAAAQAGGAPAAAEDLAPLPPMPGGGLDGELVGVAEELWAHMDDGAFFGLDGGRDGAGAGAGEAEAEARRRLRVKSRRVLVDTQRLIEELIKRGVCLGRTPGFRRADVERAFQLSTAEAY
ncbi:hypothetical protein BDY21DRAFT_102260 [Lineolata rhizophorae]|uniref:BZIP domain-containing protein n=1 Tax=Lineolata rhizophorae TaxID=578093 RepID=A0A6A6NSH2_9PEZI|nr:hypothetical protein BDY21DRAFT_102260 [Lineolata rhizophorae]